MTVPQQIAALLGVTMTPEQEERVHALVAGEAARAAVAVRDGLAAALASARDSMTRRPHYDDARARQLSHDVRHGLWHALEQLRADVMRLQIEPARLGEHSAFDDEEG